MDKEILERYNKTITEINRILSYSNEMIRVFGTKNVPNIERAFKLMQSQMDLLAQDKQVIASDADKTLVKNIVNLFVSIVIERPVVPIFRDLVLALGTLILNWNQNLGHRTDVASSMTLVQRTVVQHQTIVDATLILQSLIGKAKSLSQFSPPAFELSRSYLDTLLGSCEDKDVKKKARIFYLNLNVGSGIERTGNNILSMLEDFDVLDYKHQNPPFLVLPEMIEYDPDIILMNEFYPRVITAASYYKIFKPQVKTILLNHISERLPFLTQHISHHDSRFLIERFFKEQLDKIINLNYTNPSVEYPSEFRDKMINTFHPMEDKFRIMCPFSKRQRHFLYFGRILPGKLSIEFAEKIKNTNLTVDLIGSFSNKAEYIDYTEKIRGIENFNSLGYIAEDDLIPTLNQYRYLVLPRSGNEPFNLSVAEAMRCGIIPLKVKISYRGIDRRDWPDECYLMYDSTDSLLQAMEDFLIGAHSMDELESLSSKISNRIRELTDYTSFKNLLLKTISNLTS